MAPSRPTKLLKYGSVTPTRNICREYINHESIYQFLYDPEQQDQKLWAYLPRRHRKRRRWLGRRSRSVQIPHRVSLRHRPGQISHREEFSHWEGDTIVGDGHKTGLHPEVERISRLVFAYKSVIQTLVKRDGGSLVETLYALFRFPKARLAPG
jgi:IS30 family transposase